jgi:hypothetical protein
MVRHQVASNLYRSGSVANVFGNWLHGLQHKFRILIRLGQLVIIWLRWLRRYDKNFNDKNSYILHTSKVSNAGTKQRCKRGVRSIVVDLGLSKLYDELMNGGAVRRTGGDGGGGRVSPNLDWAG